jgi:ATP-dependent protease HslVU (ClpYQ) peptidase subunit
MEARLTTIAYTLGLMCADTQITNDGRRALGIQKVFTTPYCLLGIAGDAPLIEPVLSWFLKAEDATLGNDDLDDCTPLMFAQTLAPDYPEGEVEMLVVCRQTRHVFYLGHDGTGFDLGLDATAALGTGAAYALGAMHAGASARGGVEAAIFYDVFSGGQIGTASIHG